MAFNVGNFVKSSAKSAVTKMVDDVVRGVAAGLPSNVTAISGNIAQSLVNTGSTFRTVDAMSSLKTDSIISGAAEEFFALSGNSLDRGSGVNISSIRNVGSESLNNILKNVNPETKIAGKKSSDSLQILAVI